MLRESAGSPKGADPRPTLIVRQTPSWTPEIRRRLFTTLDKARRLASVTAPMGCGKSNLLTHWVNENRGKGHFVALVNNAQSDGDEASFWARVQMEVGAALAGSGHGVVTSAPARRSTNETPEALRKVFQGLRTPLTLVIDSCENVTDPKVATDLIELTARHRSLHLVVAGRSLGAFSTHAGSSVTSVSEGDLLFTAAETFQLLSAASAMQGEDDASHAHRRLYGWPLPIVITTRSLMRWPDSQLDAVTAAALAGALRALARSVGEDTLERLGPLSMVEYLTTDLAITLTAGNDTVGFRSSDGDLQALMVRLARNGLISAPAPGPDHDLIWRWSDFARGMINDDFVERHPGRVRTIEAVLARWHADHGANGRDIGRSATSLLSNISATSAGPGPIPLFSAAPEPIDTFNAAITAHDTNEAAAAIRSWVLDQLAYANGGSEPVRLTLAEAQGIGRLDGARRSIETHLAVLALYRARCQFESAAVVNDNLRAIMTAAASTHSRDVVGLQSIVLIESALLHELTGDSRTAVVELIEAYNSSSFSDMSFCRAEAAGKLAMSNAMLGNVRKASEWSTREAGAPPPREPFRSYVRCGGILARALIGAQSLQERRCVTALGELDQMDPRDELWPLMAYVRSKYALVWGDRLHAVDQLEQSWAPTDLIPEADRQGGVASALLGSATAELLLSLGRANQAQAVLDGVQQLHPLLAVARARLALLTGANEQTLSLTWSVSVTDRTVDDAQQPSSSTTRRRAESDQLRRLTSPVYRLECMVIRSIALQRLGATTEASDLLRRAVNQTTHLGCWLPLASAPRHELLTLAELIPSAQALLQDPVFTSMPEIYPPHLTLVTLTEREHAILRMLADGRQPRDIARTLYVSPNTVKTQTRNLYRKLNAASRGQALATARELQILRPNSG